MLAGATKPRQSKHRLTSMKTTPHRCSRVFPSLWRGHRRSPSAAWMCLSDLLACSERRRTRTVTAPRRHGDRSRRVIVSTWFGAEGCGGERAEGFQRAPVRLQCLIIMTFLKAILAPLRKKNRVSDEKNKTNKKQKATSFSCTFMINEASATPQL